DHAARTRYAQPYVTPCVGPLGAALRRPVDHAAPPPPAPRSTRARSPAPLPVAPARVKINLLNLTPAQAADALGAFMTRHDQPAYRVSQVLPALWQHPVPSFQDVSTLPKSLRDALDAAFVLPRLALVARQSSSDGTEKFLFQLHDGQSIETVAIPDGDRMTFCISSQAGCALQCAFCATGVMGFARNLEVYEIAGQVRELALLDPPVRPTNIVFMGMG